jgi:hypothetical protein
MAAMNQGCVRSLLQRTHATVCGRVTTVNACGGSDGREHAEGVRWQDRSRSGRWRGGYGEPPPSHELQRRRIEFTTREASSDGSAPDP